MSTPTTPAARRASIERDAEALGRAFAVSLPAVRDTLEAMAAALAVTVPAVRDTLEALDAAFAEPAPDRPGQARPRRRGLDAQRSPYGPRP